ncbi:MAG: c-type cytochrome biogenesis protein CcmI [Burkholderiales bacterium]
MIAFWAVGGALAALALGLVLWPLLRRRDPRAVSRDSANLAIYRDQLRELEADLAAGKLAREDYERSRAELEARVLEDVRGGEAPVARGGAPLAAAAVGLAVPVVALAVYLAVGTPAAIDAPMHDETVTATEIESMVERLVARLDKNPEDAEGWELLGRSYAVLGRFGESADAYAKAAVRSPDDPRLLADFAEALGMARGRSLEGEPARLIERALQLDPNNLKGLALAGTLAFDRGEFELAAGYWERMLPQVPPGSEDAGLIRENVAEARARAGAPRPASGSHPGLRGTVRLSPAMAAKVSPGDTLFVYARAADGPPMPLAVLRRRAGDLPLEFALDDSMAMAPGMSLSAHPSVVVTARVSRSGSATPQPGDLQGASPPVPSDVAGVEIVIDSEVR